ncbi:hypothetical protein JL721_8798 [Aureococcus anophagefferens]|nr:hypothetical protein JL721_8798 [Aureococcus anophagefferens]
MNEWRGALGAYVQKLGEYDCLSDDDEKEPALRAELLSTVLKSGTVSSRGAWGDKDWSQPQWLVLAPSRCDGEGGVAADPFLAALRDFPGDDGSSFDELEVWPAAPLAEALGRLARPIRDDPEALEDIYAEASASGVGVDDLAALVHALHDARRSRRDDDSLDDVSTQGTVDAGAIEGELEVAELRERTRRAAAAADATTTACELDDLLADGRSCGLETELANKLEGLREQGPAFVAARLETATAAPLLCQSAAALLDLAEAADAVLSPELAATRGSSRSTATPWSAVKAADDEDASLDKLREALTYAKELPRTADVVRLEARVAARAPDDALVVASSARRFEAAAAAPRAADVAELEARVVLETKREARARVRGDDGGGDDSATGLLLRRALGRRFAQCEAAELPPDELRAVARKRDAYAAGAAALDALAAALRAEDLAALEARSPPAEPRRLARGARPGRQAGAARRRTKRGSRARPARGRASPTRSRRRRRPANWYARASAGRATSVAGPRGSGARCGRPCSRAARSVTRSSLGLDPDDRDDERRHVALVAGSFDGATGAYLAQRSSARSGGGGGGPGDGGEYLLDGAALDVYAREDRCCFDVRVDGVPPLELAAAGAAERDAWAGARRALAALRRSPTSAPRPSRARGSRRVARAGDAADAETLDALRSEAAVLGLGGTADALSARLDVEALLDADVAGADDLDGLVLAIDRARFGGVGLDSPAYTRAVAKGERLLAMQQARDELALLAACEGVAALVEGGARARRGLPDEELAAISAKIDALCEAQERAFGTPKSGDRAVPAGSFTLVADALVATYKSDAAAWPPRALVDAVSAAPPLIRGPLAVRLEVHGEWTACDEAKLYGVTFQGDALAGPMLRVRGEFLPLRDCRVDEAPPARTARSPSSTRRRRACSCARTTAGAGSAPCAARSPRTSTSSRSSARCPSSGAPWTAEAGRGRDLAAAENAA